MLSLSNLKVKIAILTNKSQNAFRVDSHGVNFESLSDETFLLVILLSFTPYFRARLNIKCITYKKLSYLRNYV